MKATIILFLHIAPLMLLGCGDSSPVAPSPSADLNREAFVQVDALFRVDATLFTDPNPDLGACNEMTAEGADGACGTGDDNDGTAGKPDLRGNDMTCGTGDDETGLISGCADFFIEFSWSLCDVGGPCEASGQDLVCGGALGPDGMCGTLDDNRNLFGPDGVCGASGFDGICGTLDDVVINLGPDMTCGTADDISDDLPADDDPLLFGPDAQCGTSDDLARLTLTLPDFFERCELRTWTGPLDRAVGTFTAYPANVDKGAVALSLATSGEMIGNVGPPFRTTSFGFPAKVQNLLTCTGQKYIVRGQIIEQTIQIQSPIDCSKIRAPEFGFNGMQVQDGTCVCCEANL